MPTRIPVVNGIRGAAGVVEHLQPHLGVLVGRPVVDLARLREEPPRGCLQHHPHRGCDRTEHVELVGPQHPGVQVAEQAGLGRDRLRHVGDVLQRRGVAVAVEPVSGLGPAFLGTVAEREERLLAPDCAALPRDGEHLLARHVDGFVLLEQLPRRIYEDAVVAPVTAQGRERDEHLPRVREDARASECRQSCITHAGGRLEQPGEGPPGRSEEPLRIVDLDPLTALGTVQ